MSSRFSKNLSIHLSCLICTIKLKSFFSFCGVDGDVPAFIPDFGHLDLSLSLSLWGWGEQMGVGREEMV